jgi:hypothetical protein
MTFNPNLRLTEAAKVVTGLAPIAPSTSTPDYVSLKNYQRCAVVISAANAATVVGSAITLHQATAVAGTGEKALAFDKVFQNIDTGAADALPETAVTNSTFTTDNTNNKNLLYVIDVKAEDLDIDGGFDCLRAGTANATNTVLSVLYILYGSRFSRPEPPSAIVD